jgi:hypothetical protein
MERVLGIGGYFMRAADPEVLTDPEGNRIEPWQPA